MAAGVQIKIAGEDIGVFYPGRLDLRAAFALKATTGMNPLPVFEGLAELDPGCLQGVVWFLTTHRYDENTQRYVPTGEQCDASALNFTYDDFDGKPVSDEAPKSETSPSDESDTSSS